MFDIGWGELFLIGVVALIVVGPKDLPALFRTIGNFTGKARAMAREFQRSLEQAANESGMSEVSKSLRSIDETLNSATESARKFATQPARQMVQPEGEATVAKPHTPATAAASPEPPAEPEPTAASTAAQAPTVASPAAQASSSAPAEPEPAAPATADETRAARG